MTNTTSPTINPFKVLDFIRDHAEAYAQAKANVLYLTEYRKSMKALLMIESDVSYLIEIMGGNRDNEI